MRVKVTIAFLVLLFTLLYGEANGCTNILVTKGASKDGSVMVTYAGDSHQLYGELYYRKGNFFPLGSKMKIFEWDSGKYLGEIDQVARTYTTVGNMNEHQLIITETTFEGREELSDSTGIMDYGSLIYVTLQRAKSAREAIEVMTQLVEQYGYYSSGESFSIADKDEVWILEMIGKGVKIENGENKNRGAVWVAVKIPDGYVSAHANHSRITTFPLDRPNEVLYSKDVISFAREMGYYSGSDANFNFSQTYAPIDFSAMRACEARVWAAFNIMGEGFIGDKPYTHYTDYAMGHNPNNRMPLYIKPAKKVDLKLVAHIMRDHYEGTILDMTKDIGAGGNGLPYRWRPLSFEVDGQRYYNERAIATQQTGFWLIGQARGWLPNEVGGILWFGVDDAATCALTPIYTSLLDVPLSLREGNGNITTYSPTAAFWIFNRVANFAYSRYNLIFPDIKYEMDSFENRVMAEIPSIDSAALELLKSSKMEAKEYLTAYSIERAQELFERWVELDKYLLVKHLDGNIKQEESRGVFKDNGNGKNIPASVIFPGYTQIWKEAVVREAGEKLKVVN
ncbi:MAG: C69 family dipeptidase [Bacteroidales bacterium]